jgi:hypothetical protein
MVQPNVTRCALFGSVCFDLNWEESLSRAAEAELCAYHEDVMDESDDDVVDLSAPLKVGDQDISALPEDAKAMAERFPIMTKALPFHAHSDLPKWRAHVVLDKLADYNWPKCDLQDLKEDKFPLRALPAIHAEFDKLIAQGFAEEIRECPTSVVMKAQLVAKTKTERRFCVNGSQQKKVLRVGVYPMPMIRNIFAFVAAFPWRAKVDLKWGYYNFEVHEDDRKWTVTIGGGRAIQWRKLVQGFASSGAFFQFAMTQLLGPEIVGKIAEVYLDDLIIVGRTEEECAANVLIVMRTLNKMNFRVNFSKCQFTPSSTIDFLGCRLIANIVHPGPKVGTMLQRIQPFFLHSTAKAQRHHLHVFLGMCTYLLNHCPGLKQTLHPLYLTVASDPFTFGETEKSCFRTCHKMLSNLSVYHLPSTDSDYILEVHSDASGGAGTKADPGSWGAVLGQRQGITNPIFAEGFELIQLDGGSFNERQARWDILKKEAMALYRAIKSFRYFLFARHFRIIIDSKVLMLMHRSSVPMIQRWYSYIQSHSFELIHFASDRNCFADALTRCIQAPPVVPPSPRLVCVESNPGPLSPIVLSSDTSGSSLQFPSSPGSDDDRPIVGAVSTRRSAQPPVQTPIVPAPLIVDEPQHAVNADPAARPPRAPTTRHRRQPSRYSPPSGDLAPLPVPVVQESPPHDAVSPGPTGPSDIVLPMKLPSAASSTTAKATRPRIKNAPPVTQPSLAPTLVEAPTPLRPAVPTPLRPAVSRAPASVSTPTLPRSANAPLPASAAPSVIVQNRPVVAHKRQTLLVFPTQPALPVLPWPTLLQLMPTSSQTPSSIQLTCVRHTIDESNNSFFVSLAQAMSHIDHHDDIVDHFEIAYDATIFRETVVSWMRSHVTVHHEFLDGKTPFQLFEALYSSAPPVLSSHALICRDASTHQPSSWNEYIQMLLLPTTQPDELVLQCAAICFRSQLIVTVQDHGTHVFAPAHAIRRLHLLFSPRFKHFGWAHVLDQPCSEPLNCKNANHMNIRFEAPQITSIANVGPIPRSRLGHIQDTAPTRQQQIARAHNGFTGLPGIHATIRLLTENGHTWRGMTAQVTQFIASCPTCALSRISLHPAPAAVSSLRLLAPGLRRWHIDSTGALEPCVHTGFTRILLYICESTGYTVVHGSRFGSALEMVLGLVHVVGLFGLFDSFHSDSGPENDAYVLHQFQRMTGIKHTASIPCNPHSNGIAERGIQSMKRILRCLITDGITRHNGWGLMLPIIQRTMNSCPGGPLGISPDSVVFASLYTPDAFVIPTTYLNNPAENAINLNDGNFHNPNANFVTRAVYFQQLMTNSRHELLLRAMSIAEDSPGVDPSAIVQGSQVLIPWPHDRPPSSLHPFRRGPYIVSQISGNVLTLQHAMSPLPDGQQASLRWSRQAQVFSLDPALARHGDDPSATNAAIGPPANHSIECVLSFDLIAGFDRDNDLDGLRFHVTNQIYSCRIFAVAHTIQDVTSWRRNYFYRDIRHTLAFDAFIANHPFLTGHSHVAAMPLSWDPRVAPRSQRPAHEPALDTERALPIDDPEEIEDAD